MTHKTYIIATVLTSSASLALGVLFVIPSPLDVVLAYEKKEETFTLEPSLITADRELVTPEALSHETSEPIQATTIDTIQTPLLQTEDALVDSQQTQAVTWTEEPSDVFEVPFFSQLEDITSDTWKKVGCGIASLAMLIEFHKPGEITSVDALLQEGINANAYLDDAGWTYAGLIHISKKHGITGKTHDYGTSEMTTAFSKLRSALHDGPVMASVHYTFTRSNPIPHLVVVTGISDTTVFYNDPAEKSGNGSIPIEQFKSSWKKRYIEFYPTS